MVPNFQDILDIVVNVLLKKNNVDPDQLATSEVS